MTFWDFAQANPGLIILGGIGVLIVVMRILSIISLKLTGSPPPGE